MPKWWWMPPDSKASMAHRLHLKQFDPNLRKVAIWGYYRGAQRDPGDHGGATIILHTQEKQSWFWFIPLSNGITSIGVVGDADYLLKDRGEPSEIFEDELVRCPALTDRLMDAELVSQFRVVREFSYTVSQGAGNGWVMRGRCRRLHRPDLLLGRLLRTRDGPDWPRMRSIEGLALERCLAAPTRQVDPVLSTGGPVDPTTRRGLLYP